MLIATAKEQRSAQAFEQRPTLPISYVQSFLHGLALEGDTLQRLLRQATISPALLAQPAGRVTEEQFSQLFRGVALELDDEMPGLYARPLRCGTLKILSILMLDAPNLHTALRRWAQFNHVLDDGSRFTVRRDERHAWVRVDAYPPRSRSARLVQELHLKLVHGMCSWVIGARIELARIDFSFARPHDAADYLFMFPGPVHFDQPHTAMAFDLRYLERPVQPHSKLELRRFLMRAPLDWLFVPVGQSSTTQRVRTFLEANLGFDSDIAHVAAAFGLSARTLVRHLQAEGMKFQDIKDALRRDIAISRLTRGTEPLIAIAVDLGFSSVAAFHRAFRSWTGGTPGDYRDREAIAASRELPEALQQAGTR
ncbi:AraC family transcriptional regulator [Variovorax sp. 770b2]|uniref:AraC family transcriptional regulator n=1 Tax=Variovorax sp. 770b2 TaxID=1566271 RepID=UPI0008EEE9B1|nr:AraC family transcriptional regulator [Variovorax sp. 770b2]SFP92889.1 AraC-type DNA-binding protein [Variovorax sp. 770b2]